MSTENVSAIPCLDTLRTCDGPRLARIAWCLGLAPTMTALTNDGLYNVLHACSWKPHVNLAQADTMLRMLRERGWCTQLYWDAFLEKQGFVQMSRYDHAANDYPEIEVETSFGKGCTDDESTAILRCAVLAVATERQQHKEPPLHTDTTEA